MTIQAPSQSPPSSSRLGLVLFAVYSLVYAVFVLLNAFWPEAMEVVVFAGQNLAIVYGFALILLAMLMALVYGFAQRGSVDEDNGK